MDPRMYWIWLQAGLGAGFAAHTVLDEFPSAQDVYEAGAAAWRESGTMNSRQIEALSTSVPQDASRIIALCEKNGWQIVTPPDALYPALLSPLPELPLVLYVRGDLSCIQNKLTLAVVGTRKASYHSIQIAHQLCDALSRSGAVIVSGGALGIDSAAHESALRCGGHTVAVMGCGLGSNYLVKNEPLRDAISRQGAVISEFPPFTPASKYNFPVRNRIISGMSYGTLVIEANARSGSLITANHALEQGRDVFAVPGDIISSAYLGANKLIRDGAKPVFSVQDILEEYEARYPGLADSSRAKQSPPAKTAATAAVPEPKPALAPEKKQAAAPDQTKLSDAAKAVFRTVQTEPLIVDEIARKTSLPVSRVMAALTELELLGFVTLLPGKRYLSAY